MRLWIGRDEVGLPNVSIAQVRFDNNQLIRGLSHTLLSPFERLLIGEHPKIVDKICSHWTPDVLLKIRRLSTSAFYAVESYFCRQWNIEHHLRRWFYDVPTFLHHLGDCDGLVSGSEALTFFDRRRFLGKDLDVYLPLHGVLPMGRFLKEQGYAFQPSSSGHLWFDAAVMIFLTSPNGVRAPGYTYSASSDRRYKPGRDAGYRVAVFDFVRPIRPAMPVTYGSHIQLICVCCDPMEYIVNTFHSTGVMNVLTSTHAISLFPRTTFMYEETYSCRDLSGSPSWNAEWIEKYRRRGFKVFVASDQLPRRSELVAWKREVGDKMTWILPYQRTGLNGQAPTLAPYSRFIFEVLDRSSGVAPSGAVSRVGPRFVHRQVTLPMAWLRDPSNPTLRSTFNSFEVSAAFAAFYDTLIPSDDESEDSSVDIEDAAGDTEPEPVD